MTGVGSTTKVLYNSPFHEFSIDIIITSRAWCRVAQGGVSCSRYTCRVATTGQVGCWICSCLKVMISLVYNIICIGI
uniref:Uncharacterized protein n=1 Tax=Pararge aegeria TaxID=116150 RepID=S4PF18_9NEOP